MARFFGVPMRNGVALGVASTLPMRGGLPVPALNLDFLSGSLDSRITFTRGSTATYFDSTGTLQTAAINAARFDTNPSTLAPLGLLIEEQRTNSWSRSEEFDDASWTKGGATVTANSTTAPSGTTTADTLVEDTSTGQHRVFRTASGTTNANPYTVSFFAKASARTRVYVGISESPTFVRQGNAVFDLSAGTVVSAFSGAGGATGGSATIQNVGNGWYRCAYTLTLGGTDTAIFCDINLVSTGTTISYTGNGTGSVFLWGAQLEAGAFATSYIPTTTTALTRNADVASMTGANFSSWYSQGPGTMFAQATFLAVPPSATFPHLFSINDGTTNNFASLSSNTFANNRFSVVSGGVSQADDNAGGSITPNVFSKWCMAYATNDVAASANGGAVVIDTSVTLPVGVNQAQIGAITTVNRWSGHIARLTYYPRRLPNSTLQALTA